MKGLGRRDRSPVWTRDDMKEVDYRSFVKGFITGGAIFAGVGGVVYFLIKYKKFVKL